MRSLHHRISNLESENGHLPATDRNEMKREGGEGRRWQNEAQIPSAEKTS